MEGRKLYLQPAGMIFSTVLDIAELQKGKVTYADSQTGIIHFRVSMYGFKWEMRYTITDLGQNRSQVQIEIDGDKRNKERQILRELNLLDSMLLTGSQIEIVSAAENANGI